MDGEVIEKAPSATIASTSLPEISEGDDLKKKAAFSSWIWTTALAATIGSLLIFIASGVMSSFWRSYHHNRPPAAAAEGSAGPIDSQAEPLPADAGPVSTQELQAQIDDLEASLESQKFRLTQAEEVLGRCTDRPVGQTRICRNRHYWYAICEIKSGAM